MSARRERILLIGYGNPGRKDDGLGPALAAAIEAMELPGVSVEANYQLTVEDASMLGDYDRVLLADADATGDAPFRMEPLVPAEKGFSFSTHSVQPDALLALARDLFDAEPECYLLGIRGYEFNEFDEGLSPQAESNLAAAVEYVRSFLREDVS